MRVVLVGEGPLFAALAGGVCAAGHDLCGVMTPGHVPGGARRLARRGANRSRVVDRLREVTPDLLLVGSWPEKLGPELLGIPRLEGVNCHASLLPAHRGANPYLSAIVAGETVTGVTFHHMTERWDAGPILLQREVPISPEDTGGSLRARCAEVAEGMVSELLTRLATAALRPREQDESRATYFPLPRDRDLDIDWRQPAGRIHAWVRGVRPCTRCYSHLGDCQVRFGKSRVVPAVAEGRKPGEILQADHGAVCVATGDATRAVVLSELTAPVGSRDLLRVGSRFCPT